MVQNLSKFPAQMLTPTQKLGKQVAEQLQVSPGLYAHHFCIVYLPYPAVSLCTWWAEACSWGHGKKSLLNQPKFWLCL